MIQRRGERGRFAAKADEHRQIRSLRLTNSTWVKLGEVADSRGITRADLIEDLSAHSGTADMNSSSGITLQRVEEAANQVINDASVTRNGKDRGSVKRAMVALLSRLS